MKFTISLIILVTTCPVFATLPEKPPTAVADLRYGAALYSYFQGHYLDALTELMIAEQRGGIRGHDNQPRIMEGGFSLAYGMERKAAVIFSDVLRNETQTETRDAAWFYLAKICYLNGNWEGTAEALAKVSAKPPKKFASELRSLRINLAIRQDQLDLAWDLLEQERPGDTWLPYIYYNLGAAESRTGDFAAAASLFEQIAELPLRSDEHLALYDRAMTAAGYSYLRRQQYPEAQAQFSRVRVASPLSGSAMLGYGWAAAEQNSYLDALTTWEHLAGQSLVDENAQEALLAVPFAYEQLNNPGLALRYFEQAEQRFSAEAILLGNMVESLQEEDILDALQIEQHIQFNWLEPATRQHIEPRLTYLAELFSRNSFQRQVQELRDLLVIRDRLHQWRDKLDLYSGMLDQREEHRRRRVSALQQQELSELVAGMREQRDEFARTIARVEAERDYQALVAGDQVDLHARVQALSDNTARLGSVGQDVGHYREAHRRYAGILLWQASEAFADRLWNARKRLRELDQQLRELDATRSRVAQAVNSAQDLDPYRQRIAANGHHLETQADAVESAIARAQQQLREQVIAVLQEQQQRLTYYLGQSRLAVARLYDSTWVEQQ